MKNRNMLKRTVLAFIFCMVITVHATDDTPNPHVTIVETPGNGLEEKIIDAEGQSKRESDAVLVSLGAWNVRVPAELAEKYTWSFGSFEGEEWVNFFLRSEVGDITEDYVSEGAVFSLVNDRYDSDYRYGQADLESFDDYFQFTQNQILELWRYDDDSRFRILSLQYREQPDNDTQKDALRLAGLLEAGTDLRVVDTDAAPWVIPTANFLLNGQFRLMGQELGREADFPVRLFDLDGDGTPELLLPNGYTELTKYSVNVYAFTGDGFEYLGQGPEMSHSFSALQNDLEEIPGMTRMEIRNRGISAFFETCGFNPPVRPYTAVDPGTSSSPSVKKTNPFWFRYYGAGVWFSEELFQNSAEEYNNELAKLGAMLSCAAEKGADKLSDCYRDLGCGGDILTGGYGKGKRFAYGIACRSIYVKGVETNLLFVTARGSSEVNEFLGDRFTKAKSFFFGYNAYDLPYEFKVELMGALTEFFEEPAHQSLREKPLKIFVTGHSLGGAAANLLAAQLNMFIKTGYWYWARGNSNIYCYTFGSIDSLKLPSHGSGPLSRNISDSDSINSNYPITLGYENIHNIYNYYDSFGPNGKWFLTAAGNSGRGRFGHLDMFGRDFGDGLTSCHNHEIENYLTAVNDGEVVHRSNGQSVYNPSN